MASSSNKVCFDCLSYQRRRDMFEMAQMVAGAFCFVLGAVMPGILLWFAFATNGHPYVGIAAMLASGVGAASLLFWATDKAKPEERPHTCRGSGAR